jgi:hypothetical protein
MRRRAYVRQRNCGEINMWIDPIVEEIHQVRAEIASEHGNDLHMIARYLMDKQNEQGAKLVNFPPRRPPNWQPGQDSLKA